MLQLLNQIFHLLSGVLTHFQAINDKLTTIDVTLVKVDGKLDRIINLLEGPPPETVPGEMGALANRAEQEAGRVQDLADKATALGNEPQP